MITKRKKNTRLRGSKTHGYGSMKKHRGAGHRGGRGNAGSGKRADSKKPSMIKAGRVFGKHGFKSKSRTIITSINLRTIEEKIDGFVSQGRAKQDNDTYSINLADLGCDKLLGSGRVKHKYNIECLYATDGAVKAVEEAGGSVSVTGAKKGKPAKDTGDAAPADGD